MLVLLIIGTLPPSLYSVAYNGTKMILFGGQTSNGATPGDLYTLDMESMTWNLTQTVPSSQSRHSMACSVSGDNFIIWGGMLLPSFVVWEFMSGQCFSKSTKKQRN